MLPVEGRNFLTSFENYFYKKLGYYDTGIFATDIVTRLLFEKGDSGLAVDLMTNNGDQGYEHWRRNGATSFHEYWDSNRSRSHSHPMFGSTVAYIFEYLLGIKQADNSAGYTSLVISPQSVDRFGRMSGSMKIPSGTVSVSYENIDGLVKFAVSIPDGVNATLRFKSKELTLSQGKNEFTIEL